MLTQANVKIQNSILGLGQGLSSVLYYLKLNLNLNLNLYLNI